ncbi:hypothetical protein DN752_22595 [Echinicola strongylocentroti]|uniref:RagB/SusD family nutrient uptake outer membrane protein n=1 Tax=Echinicola strongylocentroti TaxID=1795355 RepID=A0A2Z4IPY9_9BACT|nr:RagB/SusD family nutrient uptake outer membrane protein [Echinicola strongylocentroti]AWW32708.1 hypothetical protein DN752_22595 [Echinicola strongylocentroti]
MKRYRIIILGLLWVALGCADLDLAPEDVPSDATFFSQATDYKNYMNGLYVSLSPGQDSWRSGEATSDNFVAGSERNNTIYQWNNTGVASNTSNAWNNNYTNIRNANYLLDNKGKVGTRGAEVNQYIGEAFYARAWYYFNLLQAFGGVPYIDRSLDTEDPDLYKTRESRDFIAERIIQDLDSAITLMQWQGVGAATTGRLNKETALAFKTRVGLFEGSWEYYHGQKATPFAVDGSDGTVFLQAAVEAGDMLIERGVSLFQGRPGFIYSDLFAQNDYSGVAGVYFWRGYDVDLGVASTSAHTMNWQSGSPTKSWMDNVLLSDGRPEELSTVTYDYTNQTSLLHAKDPRVQEIIYGPERGGYQDYFESRGLPFGDATRNNIYLLLSGNFVYNLGGYATYKYAALSAVSRDLNNIDNIIFRAGEALLNYAEAKAILGTITQADIDKTVNVLRDRIGMAHMSMGDVNSWSITYSEDEGYAPAASNILNEIRRERRVELFLEGFRNDDLKRWAIYEDVINGYKPRGAYFQELQEYWDDEATLLNSGFNEGELSEVKLVIGVNSDTLGEYINPLWRDADFATETARGYYIDPNRDYLQSIPNNEIEFYMESAGVALEQNPGWL